VIVAEADRDLRRFERDAIVACGSMAVAALAVSRGVEAPLGVLAGGLLMAVSYRSVKGGVDALVGRRQEAARDRSPAAGSRQDGDAAPDAGTDVTGGPATEPPAAVPSYRRQVLGAMKFFTRYALLAVGAYVMLSCFRLHPIGLLAGAVSPFLAALAQVVRLSRAPV
jgi:hypothetical protein